MGEAGMGSTWLAASGEGASGGGKLESQEAGEC